MTPRDAVRWMATFALTSLACGCGTPLPGSPPDGNAFTVDAAADETAPQDVMQPPADTGVGAPRDGGQADDASRTADAGVSPLDVGPDDLGGTDAGPGDTATADAPWIDAPAVDTSLVDTATADVPLDVRPDVPLSLDAGITDGAAADIPGVTDVALLDAAPLDAAPLDATAVDVPGVTVTPGERAAFATLLSQVRTELSNGHTPGASIAVVLRGRLAFAGAVGVRDTASGAPVTTATRFRAGSLSKMVLAATAMSLVRDGRLDVHAPITRYIPWFHLAPGYDASTLTTEHLLTHASGFPCDTIVQCGTPATRGARQAFFAGYPQPLWAPPGAVFDYANTGYGLASQVLTAAAGVTDADYEQLVHDRVFVPAGMTTATYDVAAVTAGDHATGYILNAAGAVIATVQPTSLDCPLLHPSGGVMATATDYAHLAEAFLAGGGAVAAPAGITAMESPHVSTRALPTESYGYGLIHQFSPYPTHASVWHDGELPGYLSMVWLVPDRQFAVVLMVNAVGTYPVTTNIVGDALLAFLPDATTVPPTTTPSATWDAYAGTYTDTLGTLGTGVVVSVTASGGGARTLQIDAPHATDLTGHLVPVHGAMRQLAVDTWFMPDNTVATFFPDATGVYRYLVTRRGIATR